MKCADTGKTDPGRVCVHVCVFSSVNMNISLLRSSRLKKGRCISSQIITQQCSNSVAAEQIMLRSQGSPACLLIKNRLVHSLTANITNIVSRTPYVLFKNSSGENNQKFSPV